MTPLDARFCERVIESSGLVAAGIFLLLLGSAPAVPLSFGAGWVAVWLCWSGARAVGGALDQRRWTAARVIRLVAQHLGKYVVAAAMLLVLERAGLLAPVAYAGGAFLPTVVVFCKAVGWLALPAGVDPVPYWARGRKVAHVDE